MNGIKITEVSICLKLSAKAKKIFMASFLHCGYVPLSEHGLIGF